MSKIKERIKNGERVSLNGTRGDVLCFQPKGTSLSSEIKDRIGKGKRIFDGMTSTRDRYIVEVPRDGARGGSLPPVFYAPMAGGLEKQNPRAKRG